MPSLPLAGYAFSALGGGLLKSLYYDRVQRLFFRELHSPPPSYHHCRELGE